MFVVICLLGTRCVRPLTIALSPALLAASTLQSCRNAILLLLHLNVPTKLYGFI